MNKQSASVTAFLRLIQCN